MNLMNVIRYCEWKNIDLWSGVSVPTGINKDLMINYIIKECGLLEPIYAEPETLKMQITMWSAANQWTFQHLLNIINSEYSPIENVYENRTETTTRDLAEDVNTSSDRTLQNQEALRHGESITRNLSGSESNENTVSAYNTSTYQPDRASEGRQSENETTAHSGQDVTESTVGENKLDTVDRDELENTTYEVFRHGNIGVTTNQQMINEELDLLERFNLYLWIARKFRNELMIELF